MALGYEGWAKLNINGTEDLVLCTGASVPLSRIRMDSSSGYGGRIKSPVAEMGIGSPHAYDWSNYDGSVSFEVNEDIIKNQLKPWILDRQKAGKITLQSRKSASNYHAECFWSSIGFSTSAGSAVEGSVSFTAIDSATYAVGGGYLGNKKGDEYLCSSSLAFGVPTPMVTSELVPYWKTKIDIDGKEVSFISWSLDYSQDIVKFFTCEKNANPIAPKFLAAGPMSVTFTGEYMFVDTSSWSAPDFLDKLYVTIDSLELKTKRGELTSFRDDVVSGDSLASINVEYFLYEIES